MAAKQRSNPERCQENMSNGKVESLALKSFVRTQTQKDGASVTSQTKSSLKNFKGVTHRSSQSDKRPFKKLRNICPLTKSSR